MVTLLDHGPIYRLAFLREFGPEITTSNTLRDGGPDLLNEWIDALDMVIWLDAPNDSLLKRIRDREQIHTIKQKSEKEAYEYLTITGTLLEQTNCRIWG